MSLLSEKRDMKTKKGTIERDFERYSIFLEEIKERIHSAQYEALRAVNKELINLYWDIGKKVVEKQKEHGWGKSIVEKLAKDLQKEFLGMRGFSSQNIWRMKQFYQIYCDNLKLSPLVREIGLTKNIIIHQTTDRNNKYTKNRRLYI